MQQIYYKKIIINVQNNINQINEWIQTIGMKDLFFNNYLLID